MRKKILFSVLGLFMMYFWGFLPSQIAAAAEEITLNGLTYSLEETASGSTTIRTATLTKAATSLSGAITIPDNVAKDSTIYEVTKIGENAFGGCESITNVTMPDTITEIGKACFNGCYSLSSIYISKKVTYLPYQCFCDCGFENFEIPEGITAVHGGFIVENSLKKIKFPSTLRTLLYDCLLLYVHTGTSIEIIVHPDNKDFVVVDNVLYSKDMKKLICYPSEKTDETFSVLDGVKSISSYAFYINYNLKHLIIPESVTVLDTLALAFPIKLRSL